MPDKDCQQAVRASTPPYYKEKIEDLEKENERLKKENRGLKMILSQTKIGGKAKKQKRPE